jgi:hypothetical protein
VRRLSYEAADSGLLSLELEAGTMCANAQCVWALST